MKSLHFITGLSISTLVLSVAACSSDSKNTSSNPQTGKDGGGETGGSNNGGGNNGGSSNGGKGGSDKGGTANGGGGTANGGGGTANGGGGTANGGTANGGSDSGAGGTETFPDGSAPSEGCQKYCTDSLTKCTGANKQFDDHVTCYAACALFATTGQPGDFTGDTLQCRQQHLDNITKPSDADTHCQHTGVNPTQYCK